uniref:Facilitated trehalose transporter Tret1 n=1 Tax=Cacopsylla melanoneura TaxID=428564 RepID=A0A8D8SVQ9_9HEMI
MSVTRDEFSGEQIQTLTNPHPHSKCSKPTWIQVLPQITSACIAHTLVILVGIHMAYSTVQIPHLNLTTEQASWLASLVTITNPIGALCMGPVMDRIGRKLSLIFVCIPFIFSSILTLCSDPSDITLLYISKTCAGVGSGMSTVAMVYVSEISHGDYRPALLCLNSVFISFGILLTTILNLYLDWRSLSACFLALVAGSGLLLICFVPESPHWLMSLDRRSEDLKRNKAKMSLQYLNPDQALFDQEWRVLDQVHTRPDESKDGSLLGKVFTSKQCYRPLRVLLILFSLQQLTGVYPVLFYAMQLFKQVGTNIGAGFDESHALVFLGAIRFLMSGVSVVLARRVGRKHLLVVSAVGLCLFSCLLSGNLMIKSSYEDCPIHNSTQSDGAMFNTSCYSSLTSDRLSLLFILLNVCFSSVGVIIIPWTMIGELLPSYARGTCSGFMISYGYVCMFAMVKGFPFALEYSVVGTFFTFGFMSLILIVFVYFYLPETKGKTFPEIENFFS